MKTPAMSSPIALARSSNRRRPRASHTAPAAAARASTQIQLATKRRSLVASCAVFSWSDSRIVTFPAFCGILDCKFVTIEKRSPKSRISGRTSSTTLPPLV
jgi:hypothetical protein